MAGTDPYAAFSSPVSGDDPYAAFSSRKAPTGFGGSLIDMARSIPGGLAQGAAGIMGLPGNLERAGQWLGNKGAQAFQGMTGIDPHIGKGPIPTSMPTSGDINQAVSSPFGGYYEPKTTAGRYAETAASFAPAMLGGEASLGARALGRVLAPAAGSMAGGAAFDANEHPVLHAMGEVAGALAGGASVSGTRALAEALKSPEPEAVAKSKAADMLSSAIPSQTAPTVTGRGQMAAEALGPNGVSMLATLGRRGGTTGQTLADALLTRSMGAPSRMMDDYLSASGIDPRSARGDFEDALAAGEKRAEPLYREAEKANQNIASPMLDKILTTPAGKQALSDARVKMQNDMKLMGTPDEDLMQQASEGGTVLPDNGAASGMKLRAYDYVKRALDDQVSAAYRAGNKNEGNILKDLKNKLVGELDKADATAKTGPNSVRPDGGAYARARAAASDYLGMQQAYEDGGAHILSTGTDAADVAKYVSKLSPTALEGYKGGIANKILTQAQNGRLTPRILGTPAVQEKLSAALGSDKAKTFMDAVAQEAALAKTGARMMPGTGSITSDILLGTGEQDHAANLAAALHGVKATGHLASGNLMGAASGYLSAVKHFAPDLLRSGGMNESTRNELGRLLMLSPEELQAEIKSTPIGIPQANATTLSKLLLMH